MEFNNTVVGQSPGPLRGSVTPRAPWGPPADGRRARGLPDIDCRLGRGPGARTEESLEDPEQIVGGGYRLFPVQGPNLYPGLRRIWDSRSPYIRRCRGGTLCPPRTCRLTPEVPATSTCGPEEGTFSPGSFGGGVTRPWARTRPSLSRGSCPHDRKRTNWVTTDLRAVVEFWVDTSCSLGVIGPRPGW